MYIDGKYPVPEDQQDPFLADWFSQRNLQPMSHLDRNPEAMKVYLDLPKDRDLPIKYRDILFDQIVIKLNQENDIEGLMGFS